MEQSDAKQPEHVFINLFVEENRNSPNVDVDNQAQSHARLKVDSGADMTLLNKYYCSLLGYSFDDDLTQHAYYNINGSIIKCGRRHFDIKIGGFLMRNVPISFSAEHIALPLLGRSSIFDTLHVFFDSRNKCTIFGTQ